jgi:hypothetical protein
LEDRSVPTNLVGLTTANSLVMFNADSPGVIFSTLPISNTGGDQIVGIDYDPTTNVLFGLGRSSQLYAIDPTTGSAVGFGAKLPVVLNGSQFGFSYFLSGSGPAFEVTSDSGQVFQFLEKNGAVLFSQPADAPLRYDINDVFNPDRLVATASVVGTGFAIDSATDDLVALKYQANSDVTYPNLPTNQQVAVATTVGPMGFDTVGQVGMATAGSGATAKTYVTLTTPGTGFSVLGTINTGNAQVPGTGAVTPIGAVGAGLPLIGLAGAPNGAPLGRSMLIISQDNLKNNSSAVTILNNDGSNRFGEILPFGQSYTQGVHVATADLNGDGVPDLIVGAAKGSSEVKVYDGTTDVQFLDFKAFSSGKSDFSGGVFVAAGDINGDGRAELVVGAGPGGTPQVNAYTVSSGPQGFTENEIEAFDAYGTSFNGGVSVAVGDVNGDGIGDIVTGANSKGAPLVRAFDGMNYGNVIANFYAYNQNFGGGIFVATGDLNGDGTAEIITGPNKGGQPTAKIFDRFGNLDRNFTPFPSTFTGGVRVAVVTDPVGGYDDIVAGAGPFTPKKFSRTPQVAPPQLVVADGQTLVQTQVNDIYPGYTAGVFVG